MLSLLLLTQHLGTEIASSNAKLAPGMAPYSSYCFQKDRCDQLIQTGFKSFGQLFVASKVLVPDFIIKFRKDFD